MAEPRPTTKANISRDTFRPEKNYVAVRLQQGVPLVDADWNEMNDIVRHELYDGLSLGFSDGVPPGSTDLRVVSHESLTNDFVVVTGSALVAGRPVVVRGLKSFDGRAVSYNGQYWRNGALAKTHGVDRIPDLTTPPEDRDDLVYLDVWEREVDSVEDEVLKNRVIGIETSVRIKREVAIRVSEGNKELPSEPEHHQYLPLAELHRKAGSSKISNKDIADVRPIRPLRNSPRTSAFAPAFLPYDQNSWSLEMGFFGGIVAAAEFNEDSAADSYHGVLPLTLPDGMSMKRLRILLRIADFGLRGGDNGAVHISFKLIAQSSMHFGEDILSSAVDAIVSHNDPDNDLNEEYDFSIKSKIDNSRYAYWLHVIGERNDDVTARLEIGRISIDY